MTTETSHTPDTLAGGTTHTRLQAWVDEVVALTTPSEVVWVTGSDQEWTRLTDRLVEAGTFTRLERRDESRTSFYARSDPQRRGPGRGPHLHLLPRGGAMPDPPTTGWTRTR